MLRDREDMRADGLAVPARDAREPMRDVLDLDVERGRIEQIEPAARQHALPGAGTLCGASWRGLLLRSAVSGRSRAELGAGLVAVAGHEMIVDHADRLHEGIDDGRPDELEAARRKLLRHRLRQRRLRRHLLGGAEAVDLRPAVEKSHSSSEKPGPFSMISSQARADSDRAFDLHAVAHDAGVLHQLLDLLRRVARDLLRLEIVEGAAEIVALAQDRDPRQPGLEAVEHQLLEERAVVVFRHAPFVVVIGDVERVVLRPGAAVQAVGMLDRACVIPRPSRSPGNCETRPGRLDEPHRERRRR